MTDHRLHAKLVTPARSPPGRWGRTWLLGVGVTPVVLALVWAILGTIRSEPAPQMDPVPEVAPPTPAAAIPAAAAGSLPFTAPAGAPLAGASSDRPAADEESPAVLQERARLAEVSARAHDQVAAELEQLRPEAVAKCWPGAPSGGPKIGLTYILAFSKDGGETLRSVNVSGGDAPGEVQACLRDYPVPPFRIPAPQQGIRTEVFASYP